MKDSDEYHLQKYLKREDLIRAIATVIGVLSALIGMGLTLSSKNEAVERAEKAEAELEAMNRCDVSGPETRCTLYAGDCEYKRSSDAWACVFQNGDTCASVAAIRAAIFADLHCPPDCIYEIMGHPWGQQCEVCVYKGHVGDQYKKFEGEEK